MRKTTQTRLEIDGLPVLLTKKTIKNTYLRVDKDTGEVCVNAPHRATIAEVEALVRGHRDWIEERRRETTAVPEAALHLSNPMRTALWGEDFELKPLPTAKRIEPVFCGGVLWLPVPPDATAEEVQQRLNDWYRRQLAAVLPAHTAHMEAITGLQAREYRIRDMKTCWGTCHRDSRRIYLNLKLVKYPPQYLDYVLVHELVHFLVPGHSAAFWNKVAEFCPDWRRMRSELNHM